MSRKNENITTLSENENTQLHAILEREQALAQQIRNSTTQAQAEAALYDITTLAEPVQIAFLKTSLKEPTRDTADIATALNAFSPLKEVRKEARRSLLRLDTAKLYSSWTPPIAQASAIQVGINNPPRFWRGFVTQSRDEGEVQLVLYWEQGYDYSEVRTLIFLLEFWSEGLKDMFVEVSGKRVIENRMADMRRQLPDTRLVDCTLAQGKSLIEEALSINTWRGTKPHKEYNNRLPLIKQFILTAVDAADESKGQAFIRQDLEDQETIVNFIGAWTLGDFGLAYDLLTEGSSIGNSLTRDEWITRHRAWHDEAHPTRLELGFVRERERSQSALWRPASVASRTSRKKDIEIGWSVEILDSPLGGTLRELPMGTIYKETGRHWFWTSYTLEQTPNGWRIQQYTDEGANVQGLSIAELQKRIKEYEDAIEASIKPPVTDRDALMQELTWRATQLLHFYDALLVKMPLERQIYEEAYGRAVFAGNPERILVYLERMVQRFPDNKAELQKRLGAVYAELAFTFGQQDMNERKDAFLARADTALHESIEADNIATGHILLGELYLSMKRLDEAEKELLEAKNMLVEPREEAVIEAGLGNVAMHRERMADAVTHYQRVIELNPTYTGVWFNIGFANRLLGNFAEAEASYKRAITQDVNDIRPYSELTAIYMNRPDHEKARAIVSQGIQANPTSAHLHALFASFLFEVGETQRAERELQAAEKLDPSLDIVQSMRHYADEKAKKR